MKRGEVWAVRGNGLASKPRPAVVVQSDSVTHFLTTTVCLLTSQDSDNIGTRVLIEPSDENGLLSKSWVMTDKLYSTRPDELGQLIGCLSEADMRRVSEQLRVILGL